MFTRSERRPPLNIYIYMVVESASSIYQVPNKYCFHHTYIHLQSYAILNTIINIFELCQYPHRACIWRGSLIQNLCCYSVIVIRDMRIDFHVRIQHYLFINGHIFFVLGYSKQEEHTLVKLSFFFQSDNKSHDFS